MIPFAAGLVIGGIASPIAIVILMIRVAHRAYVKMGDQ